MNKLFVEAAKHRIVALIYTTYTGVQPGMLKNKDAVLFGNWDEYCSYSLFILSS